MFRARNGQLQLSSRSTQGVRKGNRAPDDLSIGISGAAVRICSDTANEVVPCPR
jgi:hypothetical protein